MTDEATSVIKVQGAGEGYSPELPPPPSRSIRKLKSALLPQGATGTAASARKTPKEIRLRTDLSSLLDMAGEITETGELYSPYVSFTFRTCFTPMLVPGSQRRTVLPGLY